MLTITPAATHYIKMKIAQQNALGLRLSIKKTGCSGYAYLPNIIKEININDQIVECDGIKIFLDTAWQALLANVEIDYIEEDKTGLKQKKLMITSSKETARCGCGESFHLD